MNTAKFEEIMHNCLDQSEETLKAKAKEHNNPENNRLQQFYDVGKEFNVNPIKALFILCAKHWKAITNMSEEPLGHSSTLWDEKLGDLRNYTILAQALLIELRKPNTSGLVTEVKIPRITRDTERKDGALVFGEVDECGVGREE